MVLTKTIFLCCLPDNKEISVCLEMAENIGFPKLELGMSAMSKDDLADRAVPVKSEALYKF
jgi:hypothetical protein